MQVTSVRSARAAGASAIVVGMYPGRLPAPGTAAVTRALGEWVAEALEAAGFDGGPDQVVSLPSAGASGPAQVVVVGLGDEVDREALRRAAAVGRNAAPRSRRLATTLHQATLDGAVGAVVEGFGLADYRFDAYKSDRGASEELALELVAPARGWNAEADRAKVIVGAVGLCRDLVNLPAADKPPMALAERLAAAAAEAGVGAEIWDRDRLREERMAGLLGVGAGSHRPPCLLKLHHRPRRPKARMALVGKGIVFDSGGLSIKSAERMMTMKTDMAGAAAVGAATIAIARLGVPVEVTAYAALAENLPGGGAQRPGDVLTTRNGKTIEVLNTDAEGRLVMADVLALAAEDRPDLLVDLATLTGAVVVALGRKLAGVFGTDPGAVGRVMAASRSAGERCWEMPLPPDYRSLIDSDVADMKNTGEGQLGGAIAGALVLSEFVGDVPWVHVDMAGPARVEKPEHYLPRGASGFGVRTLVELAEGMAG